MTATQSRLSFKTSQLELLLAMSATFENGCLREITITEGNLVLEPNSELYKRVLEELHLQRENAEALMVKFHKALLGIVPASMYTRRQMDIVCKATKTEPNYEGCIDE